MWKECHFFTHLGSWKRSIHFIIQKKRKKIFKNQINKKKHETDKTKNRNIQNITVGNLKLKEDTMNIRKNFEKTAYELY